MDEYTGKSAKKYSQTESKLMRLFPALNRTIPRRNKGFFLDVGCGFGDYSEEVVGKGYRYYGIDVSADMIARARTSYPGLHFQVSDARTFSEKFNVKFDVVLLSMVICTLENKNDIANVFRECVKVLKDGGVIVIGDLFPPLDPYMQKFLFDRNDIETDFDGYFSSGKMFIAHKKLSTGNFDFVDHHWTLSDYFDSIKKAGMTIDTIDECKTDPKDKYIDPKYYERTKFFPTFMVLACKKRLSL
jgi:SAM-dependent methyltransferase